MAVDEQSDMAVSPAEESGYQLPVQGNTPTGCASWPWDRFVHADSAFAAAEHTEATDAEPQSDPAAKLASDSGRGRGAQDAIANAVAAPTTEMWGRAVPLPGVQPGRPPLPALGNPEMAQPSAAPLPGRPQAADGAGRRQGGGRVTRSGVASSRPTAPAVVALPRASSTAAAAPALPAAETAAEGAVAARPRTAPGMTSGNQRAAKRSKCNQLADASAVPSVAPRSDGCQAAVVPAPTSTDATLFPALFSDLVGGSSSSSAADQQPVPTTVSCAAAAGPETSTVVVASVTGQARMVATGQESMAAAVVPADVPLGIPSWLSLPHAIQQARQQSTLAPADNLGHVSLREKVLLACSLPHRPGVRDRQATHRCLALACNSSKGKGKGKGGEEPPQA